MFERFTEQSRAVVRQAHAERIRLDHRLVGTEHLLLALLDERISPVAGLLRDAGVDSARARAEIERMVGLGTRELGERDAEALRSIGIDLDTVRSTVEKSFGPGALDPAPPPARRRLFAGWDLLTGWSARAKKVLQLALREAVARRDREIGPEHILLGLLREGNGLAALILTRAGLDLAELRRRTITALDAAA